MKILKPAAIVLTGAVFMFSGFVKGVDPLGSAYKFHDYFTAFGLQALNFLNLPLAILLCTVEFFAGFSVITGIMRKHGVWLMAILMTIFTPLTFVLALTNPVSDCGCFGDAIKLTNWQTFIKNIIIDIPVLFLFITERGISKAPLGGGRGKAPLGGVGGKTTSGDSIKSPVWGLAVVILFIGFCIYNLVYLPVIDFLPYKTGTRIADKMIIPEGAKSDVYSTTFIYEKNGVRKEFTLDNYPANDTSWKFIDQKSVLKEKGYVPPIHDLAIMDSAGTDITARILDNKGYTLLMVSKKLSEAGQKHLEEGMEAGKHLMNKGVDFYVLTASGKEEIRKYNTGVPVCNADETTLKTMVRANPGYLLIKDGVIRDKWSWANLQSKESIFEK